MFNKLFMMLIRYYLQNRVSYIQCLVLARRTEWAELKAEGRGEAYWYANADGMADALEFLDLS